jgi:DNA-binding NtrC family response regulator
MEQTLLGRNRLEYRGGTLELADGEAIRVGREPMTIGRSAGCTIVLQDRQVSSIHAEVVATDRGLRLKDLGSRNGTLVNDVRVVECILLGGETIRLGSTTVTVAAGEAERMRVGGAAEFGRLVGSSSAMRLLFKTLADVAPTDLSVLITGDTGTGKELVAEAIHANSQRSSKPMVVVDCSAIAASLAESALFGHEKGAFTGAVAKHVSPFVEAHGGTVFLDEIGELPLDVQPKLLRLLERRELKSVGSNTVQSVNVRVLAATRRDIRQEVNKGAFRDDLFFRLAQEHVRLPALRERTDDIPALVLRIARDLGKEKAYRRISEDSLEALKRNDWPGNVRDLRNLVARALAYDRGGEIDLARQLREPVPGERVAAGTLGRSHAEALAQFERTYFASIYAEADGNVSEVARRAALDLKTARSKLARYGIRAVQRRRR